MTTPTLAPSAGQAPAADSRAEQFGATFFRIFNGTSVALVFWICFTLALTSVLKMLPLMSRGEWVVMGAFVSFVSTAALRATVGRLNGEQLLNAWPAHFRRETAPPEVMRPSRKTWTP